jgi:hypothetical protein
VLDHADLVPQVYEGACFRIPAGGVGIKVWCEAVPHHVAAHRFAQRSTDLLVQTLAPNLLQQIRQSAGRADVSKVRIQLWQRGGMTGYLGGNNQRVDRWGVLLAHTQR